MGLMSFVGGSDMWRGKPESFYLPHPSEGGGCWIWPSSRTLLPFRLCLKKKRKKEIKKDQVSLLGPRKHSGPSGTKLGKQHSVTQPSQVQPAMWPSYICQATESIIAQKMQRDLGPRFHSFLLSFLSLLPFYFSLFHA